ncbi:hypothetical protein KIPB_008616 [Kipferlia bialata]|uniref:Uncharacterized protein n=1 Tax=Kipferlia bialata TaxID=797122 RepID=A0A9K3GK15_9EUKA|nr:hypothetical protein KIPB_008616 [Kipferlia bialata]|eukprot:g8616.t1
MGLISAIFGWIDGPQYPKDALPADLLAGIDEQIYDLFGTLRLDPFTPVDFTVDGDQDPDSLCAFWDRDSIFYTVGPLPDVRTFTTDLSDKFGCTCTEYNAYVGRACEGLSLGEGLPPVDSTDTIRGQYQPHLSLCGTQTFEVEGQIMHVPGWCSDAGDGQFGECSSERRYYTRVMSSVTGNANVCSVDDTFEEYHNLSVSITHSFSSQVTEVTFYNLDATTLLGDVVLLLLSLVGFQTMLEGIAMALVRAVRARKAKKQKQSTMSSHNPGMASNPLRSVPQTLTQRQTMPV